MLTIKIRGYTCHPETCAHEEHTLYWIYSDVVGWVEGFDSMEDAELWRGWWKVQLQEEQ